MSCPLFLTSGEKEALGAFVKTPFRNYNKSKEKLDSHETKEYHKTSLDRAACARAQLANIERRIDMQINTIAMRNAPANRAILPYIVDAVLLCTKQQIALRGYLGDQVQFAEPPALNEGYCITILHLLAESNPVLKEHLISGPQNAWYTSKTVQNEVIGVIADAIHEYFRKCLEKNPHFSLIAHEMTSQGREVLSVCFPLLDLIADPSNPIKRKVLIDMCNLTRTTGSAIATVIRNSLKKHAIDIRNCRGQAYDTTASMSSDKKRVQAELAKDAPDAEYQGCCLHSINLVIYHACKINSIQNMMDSCHGLFRFF